MSGWRVTAWSRDARSGTVVSEDLGALAFDARHTDVDDWEVGEAATLVLRQGSNELSSVVSVRPRFRPATAPTTRAAPLREDQRAAALAELARFPAVGTIALRLHVSSPRSIPT